MSFIRQSSELLAGFKRRYEKQERTNRERRRNVTCSTWSPFSKTERPVSHGLPDTLTKRRKERGRPGRGGEKKECREGEREKEADVASYAPQKNQHRKARCRVRAMV